MGQERCFHCLVRALTLSSMQQDWAEVLSNLGMSQNPGDHSLTHISKNIRHLSIGYKQRFRKEMKEIAPINLLREVLRHCDPRLAANVLEHSHRFFVGPLRPGPICFTGLPLLKPRNLALSWSSIVSILSMSYFCCFLSAYHNVDISKNSTSQ